MRLDLPPPTSGSNFFILLKAVPFNSLEQPTTLLSLDEAVARFVVHILAFVGSAPLSKQKTVFHCCLLASSDGPKTMAAVVHDWWTTCCIIYNIDNGCSILVCTCDFGCQKMFVFLIFNGKMFCVLIHFDLLAFFHKFVFYGMNDTRLLCACIVWSCRFSFSFFPVLAQLRSSVFLFFYLNH